jgi:tetratricopeptide (TPR) repeat protein
LNLVIKSNSPQLHKNLHAIKNLVDYWVVIDESFSKEVEKTVRDYLGSVPGEFHIANLEDKNSSLGKALALSKGKGDYVLLLDSNEEIIFSEEFKLPPLTQDCYYSLSHPEKALLINNHLPWKWNQSLSGQIHSPGISEQLVCPNAKPMKLLPGVISSQEDKAHLSDPFSLFTLAQSHMEAQEYEAAFKGYEKVLALKDSRFPLYPPFYFMGLVGEYLKKGSEEIMTYYSQAYQSNTMRAEPLFRMAVYSANQQNYILGYTLAKLALSLQNPKDAFFNEDWIYHYGALFILGNCAFNLGKFEEAKKVYEDALTKPDLPANLASEIQKNLALANTQLEELKKAQ